MAGAAEQLQQTCPEYCLSLSAASMGQSSLGVLQADDNLADAAALAEDSEQHSSESDLTPSRHSQQQQQVIRHTLTIQAHKPICAERSCRKVLFMKVLNFMEDATCVPGSLTLCADMLKWHLQPFRHADMTAPVVGRLPGIHGGSAFCME